MEAIKDQPASGEPNTGKSSSSSSKLLRYPLRSATKPKDDILNSSSSSKRVRPASNVSQSVSVLNLSASGKEKSAKPPRRLSIPTKSAISPLPRSTGMITPISETRMKRPGKDGTPASDVSKSANQRKFNMISSASYWLSQIKLSETASKHSISLGFFKLALESGCEPLQKMRDELKSYVGRHNLAEHGESAKELLLSYNISEDLEELQVSVTCSQVPEDGARSSDEDIQSSSVSESKNFKPKSLNSESFQESAKKNSTKKTIPVIKTKGSSNTNSGNLKPTSNVQKNSQKSSNRQDATKVKAKVKTEKKSEVQKGAEIIDTSADQKSQQEDKENLVIEVEDVSMA